MTGQSTTTKRILTLVITCIENLIYGAVILGWPSLVFVFKQMGYFEAYCNGTSENGNSTLSLKPTSDLATPLCWQQDAQLQMVYSVALVFAALSMFPAGVFFDKFGTRHTRIVMTLFLLTGHVFCGLSATTGIAHFLFPGIILLAVASTLLLMSSLQIGNLFPTHRATAISCIQGSFGAAVLLFFVFKVCYEAGLPVSIAFFTLAGSTVFLNINTFVFFPKGKILWPHERCRKRNNVQYKGQQSTEPNKETKIDHVSSDEIIEITHPVTGNGTDPHIDTPSKQRYESLRDCLASLPFLLVLVWQIVLEFDLIFTIGTVNYFLALKADGDDEIVSRYTDIMSITMAFVFLVGPVGGLLIDRKKTWRSLTCTKGTKDRRGPTLSDASLPVALTSLVSVAYSLCLLFGNLPLQILTFVFLLLLESLLFGVGSSVIAMIFPSKHFASVYGALRTISGLVTFLQYPIFILIRKVLANDPFYIIMGFIIADVISLMFPAYLFFASRSIHGSKMP